MRILIVGNVFGNIDLLNFYAKEYSCDYIFSTGNLGAFYPNETAHQYTTTYAGKSSDFKKYILGQEDLYCPIYMIRGRFDSHRLCENAEKKDWFIKNFKVLKNGDRYEFSKGDEKYSISGLGGRYVPNKFESNSNNYEYFNRKDYEKIIQNPYDIVLLHDVIGGGSSKRIIFGQEIYELCKLSQPKFIFLGQYDYQAFCPGLYSSNFAVCPSLTKGFHLLDTKTWNLFFVKQIYYR